MSEPWVLCGWHSAQAALAHYPEQVLQVYWQSNQSALAKQCQSLGIHHEERNQRSLDKLAASQRHQGIVLMMRPLPALGEPYIDTVLADNDNPLLLVLDGVTDPHNLGACCRSALAAGVDALIVPNDHSAPMSASAVRVSVGTALRLPYIRVPNLARILQQIQQRHIWVYGAAGEADTSVYDTDLSGACALVMGSEGKGLRPRTRQCCDALLHIPMHAMVESLNVSVAAALLCFEARRQRNGIGS